MKLPSKTGINPIFIAIVKLDARNFHDATNADSVIKHNHVVITSEYYQKNLDSILTQRPKGAMIKLARKVFPRNVKQVTRWA